MDTYLIEQQDEMRPLRMFVGALTGALNGANQTYAGSDMYAVNGTYRYQSVGPYGVAIEGAGYPISTTAGGGLYISPMVVLIGFGAVAMLLLKK